MTDYKNCTSKNNPYNKQTDEYDTDDMWEDVIVIALVFVFFIWVL